LPWTRSPGAASYGRQGREGSAASSLALPHRSTFALTPEYLTPDVRGVAGSNFWFSDYGVELSREFRALKVWMSIKEHGLDRFGRLMDRNVAQAHYLAQLIEADDRLELLAPVTLDIVCFRHRVPGADDAAHNALNKEILLRLQERGIAAPSSTVLRGQYCIRVAIANHRSTDEDFAALAARFDPDRKFRNPWLDGILGDA